MKILYIIGQLSRGGAEQQLYYLLKYLRPEACVISLRQDGYWAQPIRELGIDVIELKRHGRADVRRLLEVVRIIRDYQPNIIHIFIDNPYGLYGRLAALLTGHRRVVVGVRTHPHFNPAWYVRLCRIWLNRYIAGIIVNSRTAHDYFAHSDARSARLTRFIPNGVDLAQLEQQANAATPPFSPAWMGCVIVGVVASMTPIKAPEVFLAVVQHLHQKQPNARFVWVGDGVLRAQIESLRDQLALHDVLLLPGQQMNVASWLVAFDIFVLTSQLEGTPNAIMEAMAMGLPCVVTDTGGSAELVQEGVTGFCVPVSDVEAMSARISQLIDDAALRQRMGLAGREAIQAYDVRVMADAYRAVYDELLKQA